MDELFCKELQIFIFQGGLDLFAVYGAIPLLGVQAEHHTHTAHMQGLQNVTEI